MEMLEYKPCRTINLFRQNVKEDSVTIVTFEGVINLQGAGKFLWILADGKNTIGEIIEKLVTINMSADYDKVKTGVIRLVKQLQSKGILIANWDPILKNELPQEVVL